MRLALASIWLGSFALTGCAVVNSSQVDPDTIHGDYQVKVEENSDMKFSARFTVGGALGTSVELDGKSQVAVDGVAMSKDLDWPWNIINYVHTQHTYSADELARCHEFVYTDRDGLNRRNCVEVPPKTVFATEQERVARLGSTFRVLWQSDSNGPSSDSIWATLSNSDGSVTASDSGAGTVGEIHIDLSKEPKLKTGRANLTLCRRRSSFARDVTQAGGAVSGEYCAAPIDIDIQN